MLKISLIILSSIFFVVLGSIILAESILWQTILAIVVLICCLIRFGLKRLWSELKLLIPFIMIMMTVYLILGAIGFRITVNQQTEEIRSYWLVYGSTRSLMFISTFLFLQIMISFITMTDLLCLPLSMNRKKYLILGKALFSQALASIAELEFHLRLMPEYQIDKLSLKQWFRLKLQLTYSVICLLIRESYIKGELIDNRIRHCFSSPEHHNHKEPI